MASVINKTADPSTLQYQYLASVNTPDYDQLYWVHNPDITTVVGTSIPQMYWKVTMDGTSYIVVEMSSIEKAAVNAAMPPSPPEMSDGRPIVRADSRPLDFQTYYTMVGDDSTAGILLSTDDTSSMYFFMRLESETDSSIHVRVGAFFI